MLYHLRPSYTGLTASAIDKLNITMETTEFPFKCVYDGVILAITSSDVIPTDQVQQMSGLKVLDPTQAMRKAFPRLPADWKYIIDITAPVDTDETSFSVLMSPYTHENFTLNLLVDMSDGTAGDTRWSEIRSRTVEFTQDFVREQIRTRYAMYDRPRDGLSNVVIDSFVPRMLYKYNMDEDTARLAEKLPKSAVAISPWFASMFKVRQMESEQIFKILGFNKAQLKSLLQAVKLNKWSLAFIGYGGTGVNTLHWLSEIARLTHMVNVFEHIQVFESDSVASSNLLRFPKNPAIYTNKTQCKLDMLGDELTILSRLKPTLHRRRWSKSIRYYPGDRPIAVHQHNRITEQTEITLSNEKLITYGAPNIDTREELSSLGNFISATHGSDSCSLHLNPEQDTELQVESYGVIQLSGFFMNQARLAIGLLEALADPEFNPKDTNKVLMDYSFDGSVPSSADRNYNFQLQHNGLVMTEEEAAR